MKLRKLGFVCLALLVCVTLVGCGKANDKKEEVTGTLESNMEKLYAGINEEELPKVGNTILTKENLQYYLGLENLEFEEGLASEAMIGSIPHSIVLVRVKDGVDVEQTKKDIKAKVDPRKWICVAVEENNVRVESVGNLIALIMTNDHTDTFQNNFKNLKSSK